LRPSQAELDGLISREDLCDIAGRGRKKQLALAREAGLKNFSAPAGGCLLTDKLFTARLRDLFAEREHVTLEELRLLHLGRQFRVRPALKIIVGRNEQENTLLENGGLYRYLFSPDDFPGPLVAASAEPSPEERILIASVVRRYSKATARTSRILFTAPEQPPQLILTEEVADDKWLQERMIGSAAFTAEARR
jgi:hypothetical protein